MTMVLRLGLAVLVPKQAHQLQGTLIGLEPELPKNTSWQSGELAQAIGELLFVHALGKCSRCGSAGPSCSASAATSLGCAWPRP